MIKFVQGFLDERSDAEDIVQDTFVKVLSHRQAYRRKARFSTWIYTVAGNLAKSELRKRKRRKTIPISNMDLITGGLDQSNSGGHPDGSPDSHIDKHLLEKALHTLPEKYSQIILLRDIQQLTYEEIARKTRLPLGTVKSRMNRARSKLEITLRMMMNQWPASQRL